MPRITTLTMYNSQQEKVFQVESRQNFFSVAMEEISQKAQAEMDRLDNDELKIYSISMTMNYDRRGG